MSNTLKFTLGSVVVALIVWGLTLIVGNALDDSYMRRCIAWKNCDIDRTTSRDAMLDAQNVCKELREKSTIELGRFAEVVND